MRNYTVNGTYGSQYTQTEVHVSEDWHGLKWYACNDSVNVNATFDDISEGVHVEELQDVDMYTAGRPITSPEQIESDLNE